MGRFRTRQRSEPPDGGESCRMCGVRVPVGPDGRCRLGHRVRAAGPSPAPSLLPPPSPDPAPAPDEAPADPPEHAVLPEGEEDPPALADDSAAVSASPPDSPIPVETAAWHPYDAVLALGPPSAPPSVPEPRSDGAPRSALEDLLSWDEPMRSALDVAVEELPPPPTPPAAAPAMMDGDADPDPAPGEASVAHEDAATENAQVRHRLTVLLGSGALALLALAAFAVASAL